MTGTRSGVARIADAFAAARAAGRIALMPYVYAGDPDLATDEAMLGALADAGADLVELGIPYGDPLADGPTIAAAAQRALDRGTTIDDVFALARRATDAGCPPIVAFTYYNPVVQYGLERFAERLAAAGGCGAIVPDVPLEETDALRAAFGAHGLALPLLVAPTTPPGRAATIARLSEGFVYVVSRLGVTGARREPDFAYIAERVAALREHTALPCVVGFGVSTPDHVRRVARVADGAIVASALIDAYGDRSGQAAVDAVRAFVAELAAALR